MKMKKYVHELRTFETILYLLPNKMFLINLYSYLFHLLLNLSTFGSHLFDHHHHPITHSIRRMGAPFCRLGDRGGFTMVHRMLPLRWRSGFSKDTLLTSLERSKLNKNTRPVFDIVV